MATYFVANNGSGSGSQTSPTSFASVWGLLSAGDTVIALDGTYTGSNNMLTPTSGLQGTNVAPITVKALNDGGVLIDAEYNSSGPRRPLLLENNDYFVIQGFNFRHGYRQVGLLSGANNNTIQRCIFWDSDGTQNLAVVEHDNISTGNLWEDCAFFGMGRNIWEVFGGSQDNACRRCWFRTEGQMNNSGPIHAFEPAYGGSATASHTRCENCLFTWYALSMPQSYVDVGAGNVSHSNYSMAGQIASAAFSEENCGENQQISVLGSLSYLRDGDTVGSGSPIGVSSPYGLFNLQRANNHFVQDLVVVVRGGYNGSGSIVGISLGNWSCSPVPSGIVLNRATAIIQSGLNNIGSGVSVSNFSSVSSLSSAPNPWTTSTGGNLCYRYIGGGRQDGSGGTTAQGLWPWPMNDRIKAAMVQAGSYSGPCNSCSGGRANRAGSADVTADVQTLLGTIPTACRWDTSPPPVPAPTAAFTGTPTTGTAPLTVAFTDNSLNTPTSWAWTFGDGGTSTNQNPTHVYSASGSYTVALTATNSSGSNTITKSGYIVVAAAPPTAPSAQFTATPTTGTVPFTVTFTDQSTNTPTSWAWNFGDGSTSTLQNPTHSYTTAGSYTVQLAATNAGGTNTITKTGFITANAPLPPPITPPVANFGGTPTSGTNPLTVTFVNLTSNIAPGANMVYGWAFGDGSCGTGCNPTHIYTTCGGFDVTLFACDSFNLVSDSETKANYITVTPAAGPPIAAFSGTPLRGYTPLTVVFTDCSTNTPTSWAWSFGDGTCSTSQNPSHTYVECNRTYDVTLYATNASGSDGETKLAYITVDAPIVRVKGRGHGKGRTR